MAGDSLAYAGALSLLNDTPWALRGRSYGLIMSQAGASTVPSPGGVVQLDGRAGPGSSIGGAAPPWP